MQTASSEGYRMGFGAATKTVAQALPKEAKVRKPNPIASVYSSGETHSPSLELALPADAQILGREGLLLSTLLRLLGSRTPP
jgi:hypothetical protein